MGRRALGDCDKPETLTVWDVLAVSPPPSPQAKSPSAPATAPVPEPPTREEIRVFLPPSCKAQTHRSVSAKSGAEFRLQQVRKGGVIDIPSGAYNNPSGLTRNRVWWGTLGQTTAHGTLRAARLQHPLGGERHV